MKRVQWFIVLILAGMVFLTGSVNAQVTSALWGVDGDAWNTNGILRDFTHVGYKGGAEPIPDWTNAVSVLDYGAVPDDGIDDSDAFIAAISNCPSYSAVFVPKGRYLITKKIVIERSYVVLRGEDMYESILFFPKNVSEVYIETVGWNADDKVRNTVYDPWIKVTAGQEKGIENLAIEFREQRKIKNWEYIGANALRFQGDGGVVSNCWARNL